MPIITTHINPKRLYTGQDSRVHSQLRRDMEQFLKRCLSDLKEYPEQAPPLNPRRIEYDDQGRRINKGRRKPYKRTGRLRRNWAYAVLNNGFTGTLINNAPYSAYVQGPIRYGDNYVSGENQRQLMRSKGWKSVSVIARQRRKEFITIVNRALRGTEGSIPGVPVLD